MEKDESAFAKTAPSDPDVIEDGVPRIGDVVAQKYRVEHVLGRGGMGVVLAVTHLQLGEAYAMKCLLPGSASDPEKVERFMREARASVRIKSEHIARVSDVGRLENGTPYILMEHLHGQDLSDVLADRGPLPIRDAVEYVLQACTGIAEAHALGIVHRDLKPSNLFLIQRLDGAALVKVLDFGISKAMGDGAPHNPSLTQTSSVFGSPAYMSPEQIRSSKNVDARTDVWSLGVILYELLTGTMPFTAETAGGVLSAVVADDPNPMRASRPQIPEALETVVRRCLEKKVTKRFQSMFELAEALAPFREGSSLVSVGRIRRLSETSLSVELEQVGRTSAAVAMPLLGVVPAKDIAGIVTEKQWTTSPQSPKRGRALGRTRSMAVYVVIVLGVLGLAFALFTRAPVGPSMPASAVGAPREPVVPTTVTPSTTSPQQPSAVTSSTPAVAKSVHGTVPTEPPRSSPAPNPRPAKSLSGATPRIPDRL